MGFQVSRLDRQLTERASQLSMLSSRGLVDLRRLNQDAGVWFIVFILPFFICHRRSALELGLAFPAPAILVLRLCWRVQQARIKNHLSTCSRPLSN